MTPIIDCHNLSKNFRRPRLRKKTPATTSGHLKAVDGMSFTISDGEAVGYIGANGAGKSTTIKMILGILKPTSGTVSTFGMEPMKHRKDVARRTGVVFGQRSQLWWDLPVSESFRILAAIHRLSANDEKTRTQQLADNLDLNEFWDTPVRKLSLGQRMRAEIGAALIHRPSLLVLDEPTIGLDVLSKQQLRDFLITERTQCGTTLLLTTHDLGDIQQLCERVLLVDSGTLAYEGTLEQLAAQNQAGRTITVDFATPGVNCDGIEHTHIVAVRGDGAQVEITFDAQHTTAGAVMAAIFDRGDVVDVTIAEPDIEDVVRSVYRGQRQNPTP